MCILIPINYMNYLFLNIYPLNFTKNSFQLFLFSLDRSIFRYDMRSFLFQTKNELMKTK